MTTIDPIFLEILQLAMQKPITKKPNTKSTKSTKSTPKLKSILKNQKTPKTTVKKKVKFTEEKQPKKIALKAKKPVKKQVVNVADEIAEVQHDDAKPVKKNGPKLTLNVKKPKVSKKQEELVDEFDTLFE